jgi:hypothetical protein
VLSFKAKPKTSSGFRKPPYLNPNIHDTLKPIGGYELSRLSHPQKFPFPARKEWMGP